MKIVNCKLKIIALLLANSVKILYNIVVK